MENQHKLIKGYRDLTEGEIQRAKAESGSRLAQRRIRAATFEIMNVTAGETAPRSPRQKRPFRSAGRAISRGSQPPL